MVMVVESTKDMGVGRNAAVMSKVTTASTPAQNYVNVNRALAGNHAIGITCHLEMGLTMHAAFPLFRLLP